MNKETLDHLELCIFAEQTHDVNFQNIAKELFKEVCFQKEENKRLNNIIDEIDNMIRQMIYTGYYVYSKSPYEDFEGQTVTNYMATGENSEFGRRALVILDKLKALKEDKEWKRK